MKLDMGGVAIAIMWGFVAISMVIASPAILVVFLPFLVVLIIVQINKKFDKQADKQEPQSSCADTYWTTEWYNRPYEHRDSGYYPKSMWWERYNRYLRSEKWKNTKEALREIYLKHGWNIECNKCGTCENLEVHHNNYNHVGYELEGGVITLDLAFKCKSCHKEGHNIERRQKENNYGRRFNKYSEAY